VAWSSGQNAFNPDGGVALLDATNGETRWSRSLSLPVEGGVTVAGDLLLVGVGRRGFGAEGAVVALAVADGAECWRAPLDGPVRGAPAADEARVYAAASDGTLTCLDLRAVAQIWTRSIVEPAATVAASPVLVQKKGRTRAVLAATYGRVRDRQGGRLVAFDPQGRHVWPPLEVDGNIAATPVLQGHRLYLSTYADHPSRGALLALNARTGKRLWSFSRKAEPGGPHACSFRAAPCVHRNTVYVTSLDHHLYALDAETGALRWQHDVGKGSACQPTWLRGLILFGANDGNVYAVDAETGERAWAYHLGGRIFTTPQPFPNGALVANYRGDVAALPWHLGHYAWAAERLANAGRFSEAGDCRALAAHHARDLDARLKGYAQAAAHWRRAGEMEKAGSVWLSLDRREDAARAFQQAGEHWRHRDRRRAAGYFKRAADLFFALRQDAPLEAATRGLSVCAHLPYLVIEPVGTGFIQWKESQFTLRLTNDGKRPAHNVQLCLLSGALQEPREAAITAPLAPGQHLNVPLTVTPTQPKSELVVELTYTSGETAYDPLHSRLTYTIRATERPQAAVQIGDVGMMKMQIAGSTEEGVNIETQDVGFLRNEARGE
jgi:outer membrane protein assembly factor BamB